MPGGACLSALAVHEEVHGYIQHLVVSEYPALERVLPLYLPGDGYVPSCSPW